MIIAVDCRMFDASGIGVYLRGCLSCLISTNNEFILLGDIKKLQSFSSLQNVKLIKCKVKPFSVYELFFFPFNLTKQINKADVYFSPFFNIPRGIKIPVFTTIHDIIFPDMPELFSNICVTVRMWFYHRALKLSKKIFTVSQFSKSRIEHYFGNKKEVIVTYSAIQPMFLEYHVNPKNIKKENTIIFIGNIKKHKGLDCLIDAFILAKKEGLPHKLIIVGSKDNFRSRDNSVIKKIETLSENAVIFTGNISDETLINYLSSASLLVQPSLYEGFCLPPLEAMILGTQVLISDILVLKEIYAGYPVIFFRAGDTNDLKKKLLDILNKPARSLLLSENLIHKYTFDKTASIIAENIREL